MKKKDYTLQRLDEWYYNRVRNRYTPEFAEQTAREFEREVINNSPDFPEDAMNTAKSFFLYEEVLDNAKTYLSLSYTQLINFLERGEFPLNTDVLSAAGVRKEYLDPIVEKLIPIKSFVDEVRNKSSEVFPNRLEDRLIEESFRKVFPREEDFAKMYSAVVDTIRPALDLLRVARKTNITEEELDKYLECTKRALLICNDRVLGDLYRR